MQVFANKEKLGVLTQTSNIAVQLSSSVITLGARQYQTGTLTCDLTTSGAGGIDTGSKEANSFYYIYAIIDSGELKIIASKSEQNPLGYTTHLKVGACWTSLSGNINEALSYGEQTRFIVNAIYTGGTSIGVAPVGKSEILNGGLVLSPIEGEAWTPCDGSNDSSGTTCAIGTESVGLVFAVPLAGRYELSIDFYSSIVGSAVNRGSSVTFWWSEVNSSNSILRDSHRGYHSFALQVADGTEGGEDISINELWSFTTGKKTMKLFRANGSTGANADGNSIDSISMKVKAAEDLVNWKRY